MFLFTDGLKFFKLKTRKLSDFGGYPLPKVRGKKKPKNKRCQIFTFGFECVAKNIQECFKLCTSYKHL